MREGIPLMPRRWLPVLVAMVFAGGAGVALLRADDEVYVRDKDKPVKGRITAEGPKEIKVGVKELIPADSIVDVVYEMQGEKILTAQPYRAGTKAEKDSLDPAKDAKRKENLAEALKKYEEAIKDMVEKAHRRHVEYKIAMLKVRQVQEDGAPDKAALARLKDLTKKHPSCWQITNVYQTLGRMQMDAGDYPGAEDTYAKLAQIVTLADETRMDARLLAVQAKLNAGKYDEARSDISDMQRDVQKESRFFARAKVAEAECLVAETKKFEKEDPKRAKLFDQAIDMVRGIIKDSSDKYVKAVGHNTLGYCYLEQGKPKDAMWEFLWVDVVYNQDRIQHAKALYHLWDLFSKDGDAPRAQECREALMAPPFAGLEYQKRVQKEVKTP
jgi:tetratricopeptide (TPR) repeat protein